MDGNAAERLRRFCFQAKDPQVQFENQQILLRLGEFPRAIKHPDWRAHRDRAISAVTK